MAAVTTGVVVGGSALLGAYEGRQARNAADRASRRQAQGVENAQQATIEATNRARDALSGIMPPSQQQLQLQNQLDELLAQRDSFNTPQSSQAYSGGGLVSRALGQVGGGSRVERGSRGVFSNALNQVSQSPLQNLTGDVAGISPDRSALDQQISDLESQIAGLDSQRQAPDPRQELLSGIQGQMDFTNTGFQGAQQTLNPLAQMAMPYLQEQQALLGMGGQDAYQQALSRVADPLAAEQERALSRNNAAFGGVGGNVLSALAEQTRARTEANIGNRLAQLGSASSPSLNALQNISNLRLNQGLSMADIMGGGGRDLAAQETARRQALANIELGQGSELAQLAQNLGTAQAGGAAFRAQNPSPLTAGLTAGLNAFTGMGGMGMFGGGGGGTTAMNVTNPNLFGGYA